MEDDKKLQEEFIQFLAQQLDAKTEQDLTQKVKKLGKEGIKKYYDAFVQYKQKQAKKAAHGTKLTYFKHLKNQCQEGEEVVYYKVGGRVGCGCQKIKKAKDGEEIPFKKGSKTKKNCGGIKFVKKGEKVHSAGMGCAVDKFKKHYQGGNLNRTFFKN